MQGPPGIATRQRWVTRNLLPAPTPSAVWPAVHDGIGKPDAQPRGGPHRALSGDSGAQETSDTHRQPGQRLPPPALSVLCSLLGHAAHADQLWLTILTAQHAVAQRISRLTGDNPMIATTYVLALRESPRPAVARHLPLEELPEPLDQV